MGNRIMGYWRLLIGNPDYEASAHWQNEKVWYETFATKEGCDYLPARQFAEFKYAEIRDVFLSLDRKAGWCFGVSAAVLAGLIGVSQQGVLSSGYCASSAASLAVAMLLSLWCRQPSSRPSPMCSRGAIERLENTSSLDAWLAASLHCAVSGMEVVTSRKSRQLRYSTMALAVAVVLIAVAFIKASHG